MITTKRFLAVGMLTLGLTALAPHARADLVSYWNFDESAAGQDTAFDQVGDNDGTFATATRTTGLIGTGAASFPGTSGSTVNVGNGGYVDAANLGDFSFTTGMTLEVLIRVDAADLENFKALTYRQLFRKEDGGNRILFSFQSLDEDIGSEILSLGINDGGYQEFDMVLDGADGRPTLAQLIDGNIHHLVATKDVATGVRAIYVDGSLAGTVTVNAGTALATGGSATAHIGSAYGTGEPFLGIIDEVAVYSHALSDTEVDTHWQNVQSGDNYFVPEPTTWAMLSIAMLGMVGYGWRRRPVHQG